MRTGINSKDIAKAFHIVWHDEVTFKMDQMGYPRNIIQLIAMYLEGSKFSKKVSNGVYTYRRAKAGARRGSPL